MTTTIPHLKHQFLAGQVRILNAPLDPPDEWRDAAPKTKSGHLSNKVVDDVLLKANALIRKHNAHCFPPMVLDHVAAQIDALYWSQTTTAAVLEGRAEEDFPGSTSEPDGTAAISLDADLSDANVIAALPPRLPDDDLEGDGDEGGSRSVSRRSVLESDDLATRYQRLFREVRGLAERRRVAEEKLRMAKGLLEVLAPLREPERNVQRNLVVEGGELEAELMRMKELLGRVNGGE